MLDRLFPVGSKAGRNRGLPRNNDNQSGMQMSLTTEGRRVRNGAPELLWDRLSLAVLGIAAILILATFTQYGVTWDEDIHNWYGNFALDYYLSGFRDQRALNFQDLTNYGAAFDMVAAALNRFSPLGVFETRHLLNGFVGLAGLAGCWRLGRFLGGARAGFLALVFLLLTPNWYGQMFNNPKDIPFAAGGIWALYYIARLLPDLPRPPLATVLKLGVAIGLALGVRIGGLLFLCYLGLILGLSGLWQALAARRIAPLADAAWASLVRVALPAVAVAYPIMLLFWPWAQHGSIDRPLIALANFSHEIFPFNTLFDGRFVPASDLPWTYLPTYIVVALPELVLTLLIAAPAAAAVVLWRGGSGLCRETVLAWFLVGFAIVFPVAYAIAIMAVLHPDQYVYYNAFVGGIDGAQRKFKLDYWANSYAEAVRGLEQKLRAQYGPDFEEHEFTVAVCGPATPARYYFPGNFRLTYQREQAEFFIAFTKDNCDRSLRGTPLYRVERMGVLLSVVLDRRELLAERRLVKQPLAGALHKKPAPGSAFP